MAVLSFGEILWDVYPDKKYIGGAPLNFAAHAVKCGEEVYMLSAVGDDDLGRAALKQINQWGVKTRYVDILPQHQTGKCLVTLGADSVPKYQLLTETAYDFIKYNQLTENFDVLYFGTLALRSEYNFNSLKRLISESRFRHIFADVNLRPPFYSKEAVEFTAKTATVIKISLEEMPDTATLLGMEEKANHAKFAKELQTRFSNLRCVLITLGKQGAYALDCRQGQEYFCPAVKAESVSAVGAGDSFSAAFLHKYLRGEDMAECLEFAAKIAAFVVGNYGAVPEYNIKDFQ